jgi:hypothetical protein
VAEAAADDAMRKTNNVDAAPFIVVNYIKILINTLLFWLPPNNLETDNF